MIEVITSRRNPVVQYMRALHKKKHREDSQQFFVEGIKLIQEAQREGASISFFLLSEEFDYSSFFKCSDKNIDQIKTYRLSSSIFNDISDCCSPQGIIAVINRKDTPIADILKNEEFFLVVLDEVRDPGNVGAIMRTLDAAGADGLVLLGGCADPYSPKTVRSTMGSIFRVPIFEVDDYKGFFDNLKKIDTNIMVGHTQGEDLFLWHGELKKIALVIGNESNGVSQDICELASGTVRIPMTGNTESLNAAIAASLLIYEVYRKKYYS